MPTPSLFNRDGASEAPSKEPIAESSQPGRSLDRVGNLGYGGNGGCGYAPRLSALLAALAKSVLYSFSIPRLIGNLFGNSQDLKAQVRFLKKELRRERKRTRRLERDNKALVNSFGALYANRPILSGDATNPQAIETNEAVSENEKWEREERVRIRENLKRQAINDPETLHWLRQEAEYSDEHAELLAEIEAEMQTDEIEIADA
jgi:hypothetical protein